VIITLPYLSRDVYLLDDPLSAVDAQVASHIMEYAVLGTLKNKTVVLVTHQVGHLNQCDRVLFIKNGLLQAQGPHQQLLEESSAYKMLVQAAEFTEVNL